MRYVIMKLWVVFMRYVIMKLWVVFDSQSSNLQMSVRYDFHSSSFYKLSVLLLQYML